MSSKPAGRMRIVDIQTELRPALKQFAQLSKGRKIVRIASPEMLPMRVVASREMLPATLRGTMLPPDRVCGKRLRALMRFSCRPWNAMDI